MNRRFRLVGAALVGTLVLFSSPAMGQGSPEEPQVQEGTGMGDDRLDAKGVGIAGGILIGGEFVVVTTALAGADKLWMYLTFPFLGAAGGGVGGYFLENASPAGAVALLVGGMALLIPTAILASRAMAYNPKDEGALEFGSANRKAYSFENPPIGQPPDEPVTTEVESRPPEGLEEDGPSLPEENSPANELEREPSTSDGDASLRMIEKRRRVRRDRLRRVTAGSLVYVSDSGEAGLTVPFIDVRPARYAYSPTAVEVYLPLLRVDLP